MTPIQNQFEAVKAAYPAAVLTPNPDGTFTALIPSMKVSDQWNRSTTDVRFLIPVGFPGAKPDCFWTTGGLTLKSGNPLQNTGANPLPFGPSGLLWFSWHVTKWSPLSDTILTYVHVIETRLRDPR